MEEKEKVLKFNMFLITLFLGVVVFLQSNFVTIGTDDEKLFQKIGVNFMTLILFALITLLIFSTMPKKNLILNEFNKLRKNKLENEAIIKKADKIDLLLSYIVYYIFICLLITTTIVGILVFF